MAIICAYCSHAMNAKGARAGRFTPKCSKCGRTFQLTVTMEGDTPSFKSAPLPGETNKSAAFDPNVTAPSVAEAPAKPAAAKASPARKPAANPDATAPAPAESSAAGSADFSLASSAVKAMSLVASPDMTAALNEPDAPSRPAVNLDATEAGDDSAAAEAPAEGDGEMPDQLGGYQIVKELGRGGMGAVYLARQVSLDRPVALKVMRPEWASNPNFLVRFTREAYAAAQLVHHNIIQVYDIDEDKGVNFFSMEFVEGQSLGDLVKKEKRVPSDVAAGYILQAARGLKFAHDRGMIHRDIKPDNLMLNTHGVVKVADLGLVRTPGMEDERPTTEEVPAAPVEAPKVSKGRTLASLSGVTMAGQAMGTPSYMAPEQARDATKIDHRADIYSLGCTLYVMVTGKPVFQGSNALEVMTKHASEPVVRPDLVVKDVPKALGDVVLKMVAKKPDDRYPSMDEVIKALEDFMGVAGKDKTSQTEAHVRTLEQGVKSYLGAPAAQLRSWILLGFFGGCAAVAVLLVLFGAWKYAGAVLGLGLMTAGAYLVLHGFTERTYLFLKCRDLALSTTWVALGKLALGLLLFAGVLFLFNLFWVWLLAGLLSVGLALGMHYALDRKIASQRAGATEKVEKLLRTLRVRGLSEEALHEFVARYSGEQWEEFFEALFGYEAKLAARSQYGRGPKGNRPKYAAWRDPIVRWIDRYQRQRQEARERKHLQAIEQKNLVAQGLDTAQAKEQAEAVAQAMVQKAAEIKKEVVIPVDATVAPEQGVATKAPPPRRVNVQEMFEVAVTPPKKTVRPGLAIEGLLNSLFGSTVRFAIGAVLLLVCLTWLHKNGLLPSGTNFDDTATYGQIWGMIQGGMANPLPIPGPEVIGQVFNSINPGAAGLLLLLSSLWRYWKIGFLVLLGAAIMVIGPVSGLIPALGPLTPALTCLALGGLVAAAGFLLGRGTT